MCPAAHLEPGVVEVSSAPIAGIFDIGRYPTGVDDVAEAFAAALSPSGFSSEARPDVMRFKWAQLLMNLANALEQASGPIDQRPGLAAAARAAGREVTTGTAPCRGKETRYL